jgi:4-diphosphocytidyl-2-C-methyl-D-erythritol kinase
LSDQQHHLKAYGKLNLYLDVLEKRNDGFHDIITLFQTMNICDDVIITENGGKDISFSYSYEEDIPFKPELNWDKTNTVYKAIKAIEKYTGKKIKGYDIHITKKLPPESGFGGASSDAAVVIDYFSKIFNLKFKEKVKIGNKVGSDIAFFFYQGTGIGTEKGNVITKLDALPRFPIIVCQPLITFSTPKMYSVIDYLRFENWETIEDVESVNDFDTEMIEDQIGDKVLDDWDDDDVDSWTPRDEINRVYESLKEQEQALTFNDFEKAAEELESEDYCYFIEKFSKIKDKDILMKGMTGSGSAYFIVFKNPVSDKKLKKTYEKLKEISAWVRSANFR